MSEPTCDPEVTGHAQPMMAAARQRNVARWPAHRSADEFAVTLRCGRWKRSFAGPCAESAFEQCLDAFDRDHPPPTDELERIYR